MKDDQYGERFGQDAMRLPRLIAPEIRRQLRTLVEAVNLEMLTLLNHETHILLRETLQMLISHTARG